MKMPMQLLPEWRHVLVYAWSIKYSIIAGLFAALEVALPLFQYAFPHGLFAGLSMVAAFGSVVCRLCAQKEFTDEPKPPGVRQ